MQKNIKTALMMGNGALSFATNAPHTENDAKQYFVGETKAFFQAQAQWSSNMVTAQVQGVDYQDFYKYHTFKLRTSSVINPTTGTALSDDWQKILIVGGNIDYVPRGAKITFNGNTWLVVNPSNIQSVIGTAIVRRCGATWNHLDYYGNVLSEPFCFGEGANNLATANNYRENMVLMNEYQHACMQYSPETSTISQNIRMILGNQCYSVRGVQNFVQEFSSDQNSVHIQYFDLAIAEPLEIDDMVNRVAGGMDFRWKIYISGVEALAVGDTATFTASSTRNEVPVESTEENPIHYVWSSGNTAIATIDPETGVLTGVSAGTCVITCSLVENPHNQSSWQIEVSEAVTGEVVVWNSQPPESIAQYSEATLTATYYENGVATTEAVTFALSGANPRSYTATVNGNSVRIQCWEDDPNALIVTATRNGKTATATIELEGW